MFCRHLHLHAQDSLIRMVCLLRTRTSRYKRNTLIERPHDFTELYNYNIMFHTLLQLHAQDSLIRMVCCAPEHAAILYT